MLVLVEGASSCVEVEVGVAALVDVLSWVEVEAKGATRVEESLIAILYKVDGAVGRFIWGEQCSSLLAEW